MNVSLSSLERLLHRYTMESTTVKPFDVRSVPVESVRVEQPKGLTFEQTSCSRNVNHESNAKDIYSGMSSKERRKK